MRKYLISPGTLADMLADAFVDLREIIFDEAVALQIVDHVYGALAPDNGPVAYSERAVRALFVGLSEWIRARVRNGEVLSAAQDILVRHLTDPFYLDQHL